MTDVQAWIATHKPQAAAGGLVAVAGLVTLVKRRKAAAAGSSTAAPTAASVYGTATGTAGTTTTGAAYDSSANDVYNSVQGVLQQLQTTASQISATAPISQQVPVTPPMQWSVGPNPPFATLGGGDSAGVPATSPVALMPAAAPTFNPSIGIAGGYQVAGQTYSQLPSLQGLPPGTAEYTVTNGVPHHLSPAEAAALPKGTAIFVQGNDNK